MIVQVAVWRSGTKSLPPEDNFDVEIGVSSLLSGKTMLPCELFVQV